MGLFPDDETIKYTKRGKCVKVHSPLPGKGPEGETCGTCEYLVRVDYNDRIYYKCELRKYTHGEGSDIRLKWLACGQWHTNRSARAGER